MRSYICDHECDVYDPESIRRNLTSARLEFYYDGIITVWWAVRGVGVGSLCCTRPGGKWEFDTEPMPWIFCHTVYKHGLERTYRRKRRNMRWTKKRDAQWGFLAECRSALLDLACAEAKQIVAQMATEGGEDESTND